MFGYKENLRRLKLFKEYELLTIHQFLYTGYKGETK